MKLSIFFFTFEFSVFFHGTFTLRGSRKFPHENLFDKDILKSYVSPSSVVLTKSPSRQTAFTFSVLKIYFHKRLKLSILCSLLNFLLFADSASADYCSTFPVSVSQSVTGVTSQLLSIVQGFGPYKPYIFWKVMI